MYLILEIDGIYYLYVAGLVSDIFNCVASTLTFPDFMAVFYGQSAPLQRLREPLQTLIRDKVLEGREPTQANVNTAVKRLLSDMSREIDAAVVSERQINQYWDKIDSLIVAWQILMRFWMSTFQVYYSDWWLRYLRWNCSQKNVTRPYWW